MRGFRFGQVFIVTCDSCLRPSADETPCRTREKKPLFPRLTIPKLTKKIRNKGDQQEMILEYYQVFTLSQLSAQKFLFYEVILSIKQFLQFAITSP